MCERIAMLKEGEDDEKWALCTGPLITLGKNIILTAFQMDIGAPLFRRIFYSEKRKLSKRSIQ